MHADEKPFVSLADFLRTRPLKLAAPSVESAPPREAAVSRAPEVWEPDSGRQVASIGEVPDRSSAPLPYAEAASGFEAVRQARLFSAALGDAFDLLVPALTRELAGEVLGRELNMAPVDLETLARRLIAERLALGPLRLRVAPADSQLRCELPVVTDPSLAAGDAVLECRCGDIDARLLTRLTVVLERVGG